jgi:hypothetical protein
VRIGYGSGDELVEGGWRVAYTVPAPKLRSRRRQALEPQHELAGVLAGRRPAWPSEDLALRARLDVDHGRLAQAALQLQAALTAFEAELEGRDASVKRFASGADPAGVRSLVDRALSGPLSAEDAQELEQKVSELERVLRRRRFEAGKR